MNRSRLLAVLLAGALSLGLAGCAQPQALPTPTPPPPPTDAAVGEALAGDAWSVTVDSADLDATAAVAAANEFNPEPGEGTEYATVTVTVTRTGSGTAIPLDVNVTLIVAGDPLTPAAAAAATPLDLLGTLEPRGEVTGDLVFIVPTGTTAAQVRITPGADAPTYLVDVP